MSGPGGFEGRIYDAFEQASPPAGSAVVRQAQLVQTYTEATGQHGGSGDVARSWAGHADPVRVRQAATAVVVSRAAVVIVLCLGSVAVALALLVRVLEWIA